MIDRILIPLDGSEIAEGILIHVERLLVRTDAEVLLLHVQPAPVAEALAVEFQARAAEQARYYLEGHCEALEEKGARARFQVRVGDPAHEIYHCSVEEEASLIAMSTHGREGLDRWILGSVAERVMRASGIPLLLANPAALSEDDAPRRMRFRRILLPLDGSRLSAGVVPVVKEIARLCGSEVILLHVPPTYPAGALYPEVPAPAVPAGDPDFLNEEVEVFEDAGIEVRVRLGDGLPAVEILAAVEEERASLVAMTTHGRTGLSRWVLGSVAEKVIRSCPVPILVQRTAAFVRPGELEEE